VARPARSESFRMRNGRSTSRAVPDAHRFVARGWRLAAFSAADRRGFWVAVARSHQRTETDLNEVRMNLLSLGDHVRI